MDRRSSFTDIEYSMRKQIGTREEFLNKLETVIDWEELTGIVKPFYPQGDRGRPVKPLDVMIRMYLVQNWFGFSAAGTEGAVYDSYAFRKFIGVSFLEEQVPDSNTLCRFRRLLKKNGLEEQIFATVDLALKKAGMKLTPGSAVEPRLRSAAKKKNKT